MKFKNVATGEVKEVTNLRMLDGRIFFTVRGKGCGAKFFNRNTCVTLDEHACNGTFLKCADGWEVVVGESKTRAPRAKEESKAQPVKGEKPEKTEKKSNWEQYKDLKAKHPDAILLVRVGDFYETYCQDAVEASAILGITLTKRSNGGENPTEMAGFPHHALDTYLPKLVRAGHRVAIFDGDENGGEKPEPEPAQPEPTAEADNIDETAAAIAAALRGVKHTTSTLVDEAKVEEIVRRVIAEQPQTKTSIVEVKVVGKEQTARVQEPHPLLKKVLALVVNDRGTGRYPWLFGPAGSGKSTLAKQIADALKLPFYSVSSLQQKYELEGYTDATGSLVETVFYKAAKEGGIFLFDEASTTSGEVQVAFNSMLANLWYNFPKEGMVTAHPDFHIIAADNTTGHGGNSTYSARFQLDASTLDRYTAIRVDYTDEQDNKMAEEDTALVAFIRDVRKVIEEARLTYTASPRALRAIKSMQKMEEFTEDEALELGLCSAWSKQDIKTINARLNGSNKYYKMFDKIANK